MYTIIALTYGLPRPSRAGREGAFLNVLSSIATGNDVTVLALTDALPTAEDSAALGAAGIKLTTLVRDDVGAGAGPAARRASLKVLSLASLSPTDIWRFNPRRFRETARGLVGGKRPDCVLYHQWYLYPTVQNLPTRRVYYAYEVEWLFGERFADEADNPLVRSARSVVAGRRKKYELKGLARADGLVCASAAVASELSRYYGRDAPIVIPPVTKAPQRARTGYRTGELVYFTDVFGPRDLTAVKWLIKFVMPAVGRAVPNATLTVLSERSPLKDAPREPWLRTARGPADETLGRASIAVFPHWSGGGTNFAALNALAFGLPVVATPVGAEGTPGTEKAGVAVRLYAKPFAEEVIKLLTNGRTLAERSKGASAYAEENLYSDVNAETVVRGAGS